MSQHDESAASAIRVVFNGPALAGIGATTDAGLVPAKYHVLPWSVRDRVKVNIEEGNELVRYRYEEEPPTGTVRVGKALRTAMYNVEHIYGWEANIGSANDIPADMKAVLKRDCVAIIFVMIAHGYYDAECREQTAAEKTAIQDIDLPEGFADTIINTEALNRAATFLLARMHTKYQTNHVLGGTPMQASMASAVRAFYNVSQGTDEEKSTRATGRAVASMLHWALHPANERLLIPAVIDNSQIKSAYVHANGPPVTALGKEEYFSIRANTPPASTHHFYVAAAAVQHLEPLGILPYMPTAAQMKDIKTGWLLIAMHGAKLHPAARHWGLPRVSANQKLVEPVCADLGYAVKKLMPGSSLASSPILAKKDALNPQWKAFIDAIRAAMDKRGEEMLDDAVLLDIKKSILPTKTDNSDILAVKRLMIQTSTAPDHANGDEDHSESDDDDEHSHQSGDSDGDDDDDDGPPAAPAAPVPASTSRPASAQAGTFVQPTDLIEDGQTFRESSRSRGKRAATASSRSTGRASTPAK